MKLMKGYFTKVNFFSTHLICRQHWRTPSSSAWKPSSVRTLTSARPAPWNCRTSSKSWRSGSRSWRPRRRPCPPPFSSRRSAASSPTSPAPRRRWSCPGSSCCPSTPTTTSASSASCPKWRLSTSTELPHVGSTSGPVNYILSIYFVYTCSQSGFIPSFRKLPMLF